MNDFENITLDKKRNNLKEYILLIDGKADELTTLKSYLVEYYKTYNNSVHHVKEFVFGTQIMRLLYLLNLPDEAVKVNEHFFLSNRLFTQTLLFFLHSAIQRFGFEINF